MRGNLIRFRLRAHWLAGFALLLGSGGETRAKTDAAKPALAEAWQALSIGFYADAAHLFAQAGEGREARLGAAIASLNRPPVTRGSLDAAERVFEELAAGDDRIAHAALYFAGRWRQLHPMEPDPAGAERCFERLVATGADDAWCRLALVKLAILRLTAPTEENANTRLAQADWFLSRAQDEKTARDLHLVIAEVRLDQRRYDAETLEHLEAALAGPRLADDLRADLLIQCGRLAAKLDRPELARARFQTFLDENPKERRNFTVRQALADLPGELRR
jgi:hypothetical protein